MMQNAIKIKFFGAFKKCGDHEIVSLPANGSVEELKSLLAERLSGKIDRRLVHDSAIACNDTIVAADYKVRPDDVVSILPPVCGG